MPKHLQFLRNRQAQNWIANASTHYCATRGKQKRSSAALAPQRTEAPTLYWARVERSYRKLNYFHKVEKVGHFAACREPSRIEPKPIPETHPILPKRQRMTQLWDRRITSLRPVRLRTAIE
jgi:hypothetical protein